MARSSTTETGQAAGAAELAVSANGRFVAFQSGAPDVVAGDTNNVPDIFVRDHVNNTTERVSISTTGAESTVVSAKPSISGDGRYVVFHTIGALVTGDTNTTSDVFVRDTQTDTTTRVSVATDGSQVPFPGADHGSISADGRYVAFNSFASNLVTGDTNSSNDVFLRDRMTSTTTRLSVTSGGAQGVSGDLIDTEPSISADGNVVAFATTMTNLVTGDTNARRDVFVRDRTAGTTTRVSVATGNVQSNGASTQPVLSADGRYVAFKSEASNLVASDTNGFTDIFVHDRTTGVTSRVSTATNGTQANQASEAPSLSGDGRYVAFDSDASNLVPGDTNSSGDVFVRDLQTNRINRASTNLLLAQSADETRDPKLSQDGRYLAFASDDGLVQPDTNAYRDVFLRANQVPTVTTVSPTTAARGVSTTITVTGTNFLPGVSGLFGNSIAITSTVRLSETQVQFTLAVDAAAGTGPRTVFVVITGTGPGVNAGAAASTVLTIT